jgi:hypothetical protein
VQFRGTVPFPHICKTKRLSPFALALSKIESKRKRSRIESDAREKGCGKLKIKYCGGAVAQLGARLDGIEEVVGSNPIGSTN